MGKIYVIGIGYRPLNSRAREIVNASDIILANERLQEIFRRYDEFDDVKDRIKIINTGIKTIEYLRNLNQKKSRKKIALLADGDPMFYGIGKMLVKEFGRDSLEVYPDLSSIQVSFSRISEPWSNACLISLHGGPDPNNRRKLRHEISELPKLLDKHDKIAILTDKINNPSEIAKVLNSSELTHKVSLIMYVFERLGYQEEKITKGLPREIAGLSFTFPNVVIILRDESRK